MAAVSSYLIAHLSEPQNNKIINFSILFEPKVDARPVRGSLLNKITKKKTPLLIFEVFTRSLSGHRQPPHFFCVVQSHATRSSQKVEAIPKRNKKEFQKEDALRQKGDQKNISRKRAKLAANQL